MILTIKERIILPNIFPKESSFLKLNILSKLKDALKLTEKEIVDQQVKQVDKILSWKEIDTEIEISEEAKYEVIEALKDLDKKNKLSEDYLSIYKKFILEK